ncbi:hypothetical protein [Acidithiobacillus sp.]|uniref:hypothetical protein n=1 Tax=Acidithiobacillus sp. TaxID=1872118 RepID=UPI00260D40A7|nr:hypothetical protein [Acidithiobacillus sp.]MDD5280823.1 hypothetical protein [Acidithiobacillus sp.]
MKLSTKIALRVTVTASLVFLSGCAEDNPWVKMSTSQTKMHPTLNRALIRGGISGTWPDYGVSPSKNNKETETEFFYQSVGPAPLIVGEYKTNQIHHKNGAGINAASLSQIGISAAFPDMGGGISAGGMALGIAGLLFGGGSTPVHLTGLDTFKTGQELYAVRMLPSKLAANKFIPKAAETEAEVPAQFSGTIIGHTAWENRNTIWEPYKVVIGIGPGNSFELVYKMLPHPLPPETVDFAPVAVWDDCLQPLAKQGYAITDQWAIGNIPESRQVDDTREISKEHPGWIFVLARSASTKSLNARVPNPLVCENGNCKAVAFKG